MKHDNIIIQLTVLTLLLLCASCANKKVIITGPVGTEIYSPTGNLVATIGASETISHKMNEGDSYLLKAKIPNSDVIVPFALDYKKDTARGMQFLLLQVLEFIYLRHGSV